MMHQNKRLWTLVIVAITAALLLSAGPLSAAPAVTYSIRGYARFNGTAMSDPTVAEGVEPTIRVRDIDANEYVEDDLQIIYNEGNGHYIISGVKVKKYAVYSDFLVVGTRITLPGNYRGYGYYDLPNLTPEIYGSSYIYRTSHNTKIIMHQTKPWNNSLIDTRIGDPYRYRRHSSPVVFDWDNVNGAVKYGVRIDRRRDSDHALLATIRNEHNLIASTWTEGLLNSSYITPNHYEVTYFAYNGDGDQIGDYQTTYINGSGVNYRFKVAPKHTGPVWYVKKGAVGYNNGSSWFHAFNSLQDAIVAAADAEADNPDIDNEIWVAADVYYPDEGDAPVDNNRDSTFDLSNGVAIYGGFIGNESSRHERDWNDNVTILSGDLRQNDGADFSNNSDNSYHVVYSNNNPGTTILDGFTITAGNANEGFPENRAGGLYARSSDLAIANCRFKANSASFGGGIYAAYDGGNPTIITTAFIGNIATGAGGAIAIQHSYPLFQSCLIIGNEAESNGGGAWSLDNTGGAPEFTNCLFSGNVAGDKGGGLYQTGVGGTPNPNPPIMTNCTIANNTAGNGAGGVVSGNANDLILDSCILWGNDNNGVVDQAAQVSLSGPAAVIKYTCVEGWTGALGGPGNAGDNPMFVDDDGFDDEFGTEDDNYRLLLNSPCINTGNPAAGYEDPDGSRNDMGAYGGPWADQSGGAGSLPGSGFLFTTVGNIPTAFITDDDGNADKLIGAANLTAKQASQFHIHQYVNTPFGSTVRLHGLFGADDGVAYYEVLIADWTGSELDDDDFEPLTDTLYKVEYTYNETTHEWEAISRKIGPHPMPDGRQLYINTYEGFWSHLDVRLIWNTRRKPTGVYVLRCKGYSSGYMYPPVVIENSKDLIIRIDNSPVDATIHNVKYDEDNPNYSDIDDGEILECAIIGLTDKTENLRFTITASHPNGHLRYWQLDAIAGKNDLRGLINHQSYGPTVDDYPYWFGVDGEEFRTENAPVVAPNPPGVLKDWKRCAYQFRLRAWANVTNGYNYIFWDQFSDHYYIDFNVTGCNRADIDNNGTVDMADLNIFSLHWLETCPVVK